MERVHDRGGLGQDLLDGGGVAGESVHGHHLHILPELRGAFLKPGAQHLSAAPGAHAQQAGRTVSVDQRGQIH